MFKECNSLKLLSFQNIVGKDLEWYKNLKKILNHKGLANIHLADISDPEVKISERSVDIFYQNSFAEIKEETSKLRTLYSLMKKEAGEDPC